LKKQVSDYSLPGALVLHAASLNLS